jgi:ketosteroid isomerase-like protein
MKAKIYFSNGVISLLILTLIAFSCSDPKNNQVQDEIKSEDSELSFEAEKQNINNLLDSFNLAAANADFDLYFSYYADDAVFIGTDATENWCKDSFMVWAKPFFDRGRAWDFKAIERTVYFDESGSVAWFDELLDTQMKICRGSGVLVKIGDNWKIKQYVLSMTIPNSKTDEVVELKSSEEDALIEDLRN